MVPARTEAVMPALSGSMLKQVQQCASATAADARSRRHVMLCCSKAVTILQPILLLTPLVAPKPLPTHLAADAVVDTLQKSRSASQLGVSLSIQQSCKELCEPVASHLLCWMACVSASTRPRQGSAKGKLQDVD